MASIKKFENPARCEENLRENAENQGAQVFLCIKQRGGIIVIKMNYAFSQPSFREKVHRAIAVLS